MPELPEVECVRRGLLRSLPGQEIATARVLWPGSVATHTPEAFAELVRGARWGVPDRRGKYLILPVPPRCLVVHLRMTGRLFAAPHRDDEWEYHPHTRLILEHTDGSRLYLRDIRKFARVYLVEDPLSVVGALGPEPLAEDLTAEVFDALLSRHRRQIKPLLLDQHVIAGLGNIYADESLWVAGIHPLRSSDSLSALERVRLYKAIRNVLSQAIVDGGSTIRDYHGADDRRGSHQQVLAVYGRRGRPCPRCGSEIIRSVVAQRGTHWCPTCQPLPGLQP
ncbi:MAG: bifunctional DNA-formamidopyrimidine glycosylase/DNA-(apurinic or apyrimidinic site) lyase [Anaerolineae bacterium]|jgi:formamidopyrimidine-DNA glycosylase|nr:bifunctional DNA-formamidopyrimidine glycosylase/DNA-(apurinic or apyrimidinic site) lyase [Chloroflexota bacterium]